MDVVKKKKIVRGHNSLVLFIYISGLQWHARLKIRILDTRINHIVFHELTGNIHCRHTLVSFCDPHMEQGETPLVYAFTPLCPNSAHKSTSLCKKQYSKK